MDKKISLLLINTVPTRQNGQTMFLLNYLRNMDRSDIDIGFVATNTVDDWVRSELCDMNVRLYEMPYRNRHAIKYMGELRKLIKADGYNVVHVHGNSSTLAFDMLAARMAGAPVRIAHSHNTRCKHIVMHRLLRPVLLRCANVRFACGREAGEWLFPGREFEVIRNASDGRAYGFDAAKRDEVRQRMGLTDRVVIGTVAAICEQKNPLFLLEAFLKAHRKNGDLHLVMMGDGAMRAQVEDTIGRLGLQDCVTLTGRINDVPDRLHAMDVMVLPSLYEGFPCVLVEWQLNGLRALVSDAVTRDCDLTGKLEYLPLDEDIWAEKMAGVQPEDRTSESAECSRKVAAAGFDIHTEAARLKRRYKELLEENAH